MLVVMVSNWVVVVSSGVITAVQNVQCTPKNFVLRFKKITVEQSILFVCKKKRFNQFFSVFNIEHKVD